MEPPPALAHPFAPADVDTEFREWARMLPAPQVDDMMAPIVQHALTVLCGTAPPPLLPRDPRHLLPRAPFVNVRNLCFINASMQVRPSLPPNLLFASLDQGLSCA